MSTASSLGWRRPLRARGTDEQHRAATPLELFFDLCFVVAVAQCSSSLHHALADDHLRDALVGYPSVFFAIWWAWMNFTWFASAYDNDDALYRLAVFVQIAGVLILAAGVPRAVEDDNFGIVTLGYAVMRVALVAQWLRAAGSDPERRVTACRYAIGVGVCMIGWIAILPLDGALRTGGFLVMVAAELLVPLWAERPNPTSWHPGHIAERYGLFTLIVLGESVLAATVGIQQALDAGRDFGDLVGIALGGLLTVFSLWWVYFALPAHHVVEQARAHFGVDSNYSFVWGYGHFVVFASAAAVGGGLAVAVDVAVDDPAAHIALSARGATLAVAIPVALYLVSVWLLHAGALRDTAARFAKPGAAALVVVAALAGLPILAIGVVLTLSVIVSVVADTRLTA